VQLDYRFVDLPSGFQIQQTRFRTSISTREALFSTLDRVVDTLIEALGKRIVMKDGSTAEIESSPLSLSDRERAQLHEPFAKSIETLTRFGDGLAERRRGRLAEATGRLKRTVKLDADFAEAWGWLGIVQMEAGRLKEAAESLTRALSLLRARGGGGGEGEVAAALRRLAQVRERRGATRPGSSPLDESLRIYRESLGIDRRLGNEARAARTLGDIARVLEKLNRAGEAMARLEASLAVFRRTGMEAAAAETLGRLADLHAKAERFDESLRRYRESLALLRRLGDSRNETKTFNRLADVWVRSRRYPKAIETYRKALRISRDRTDGAAEADTLNHLSADYFRMDRFSKALEAAGRAYAIRSRRRDWAGMADALNSLGAIHVKLGQPAEALESWCDGRTLARRQGLKKRERRFDRSVKRFIRLHPRLSCPY
jgi:tetratricopeptide (TPR) repeat protein